MGNPLEVLGGFLRALGVSGSEIPDQVDEATAAFRTRVAGRRLLLVLDNAVDEAQIRRPSSWIPARSVKRAVAAGRARRIAQGVYSADPLLCLL